MKLELSKEIRSYVEICVIYYNKLVLVETKEPGQYLTEGTVRAYGARTGEVYSKLCKMMGSNSYILDTRLFSEALAQIGEIEDSGEMRTTMTEKVGMPVEVVERNWQDFAEESAVVVYPKAEVMLKAYKVTYGDNLKQVHILRTHHNECIVTFIETEGEAEEDTSVLDIVNDIYTENETYEYGPGELHKVELSDEDIDDILDICVKWDGCISFDEDFKGVRMTLGNCNLLFFETDDEASCEDWADIAEEIGEECGYDSVYIYAKDGLAAEFKLAGLEQYL